MYARYGYPVYLIGSAIHDENARDYDILVILPDESFEARYGSVARWRVDRWNNDAGEVTKKWSADVGKLADHVSRCIHKNVDFKVYPESYAAEFANGEKVRLDSIPDEIKA